MANYSGRRGPNVSQYLRELNAMPSDTPVEDHFPVDDELALFTNTQFFDFESGQTTDFQPQPGKPDSDTQSTRPEEPSSAASAIGDFSGLDFISGDFNFGDFGNSYASPTLGNFSENLGNLQPIQPNPQAVYPAVPNHQGSYGGPSGPHVAGELKRKASETTLNPNRPMSMEEATRLAAEEDKRRRNTAASARFRVKKKQREQALEKNNKEMNDKVTSLEGRIQQLETENKWLKNLIMEKNGDKEDITSMWKDFSAKKELEANQGDEEKTDEKTARATDGETVKAEN